jgi:hypothetical protein
MKSIRVLLFGLAALAACDGAELPTASTPIEPKAPSYTVDHWPTGGVPGFLFTFANIPSGAPSNPFDGTLSPTVEVCRVTNDVCGPVLATFTRTSGSYGRLVTVDTQDEEYQVTWPTGSTGAQAGQVYRVSVRVGTRSLGFMDVRMITNWWELFTTDTNVYYPWIAGANLNVTFRIEQGIPGSVQVTPTNLHLNVGDGRSLNTVVRDLHGQTMAGASVYMYIENGAAEVATLDSGLVVGVTGGTATLWAGYGDVWTEVPVTVNDTRRQWIAVGTQAGETHRAVWGTSASDLYTATHTGVMRWNGSAWSYADPVRWRELMDVRGFTGGRVWGVGRNGVMVRWNGTAWDGLVYNGTAVTTLALGDFTPPARRISLNGIWGTSESAIVVVGDSGTVLTWNGTTWQTRASGTTAALTDVWGTSLTDFYATTADGRVLRFGASTVTPAAGVQAPGALNAVWGSSASNIYAVGEGGMMYRYNGSSWSRIRLPTRAALTTVWGSSASEVYAAGSAGALYRYNGTAWTPEKRPGGDGQMYGVWGLSGGNIYVVGNSLVARR